MTTETRISINLLQPGFNRLTSLVFGSAIAGFLLVATGVIILFR